MSDFDQFETAEQPPVEEDPAAAFLAREQDDLAALETDEFGATDGDGGSEPHAATLADQNDFGSDAFGTQVQSSEPLDAADSGMFDPLGSNVGGDGDMFLDAGYTDEVPSSDPYTAIKQVDTQRAEPEKVRIWREQQKEVLEKKDEESEQKMGDWRQVAKKELEDWYKHRNEQMEKGRKTNREHEDAFIQERDENIPGHEWERICRLCDFNPKASRTNKDISRMRSILLQLKQSPIERVK